MKRDADYVAIDLAAYLGHFSPGEEPTSGPRSRSPGGRYEVACSRGTTVVLHRGVAAAPQPRAVRIPRPGQLILVAGQARGGSLVYTFHINVFAYQHGIYPRSEQVVAATRGSTAAESAPTRSSAPLPTTWPPSFVSRRTPAWTSFPTASSNGRTSSGRSPRRSV